jgi:hypothetical protein
MPNKRNVVKTLSGLNKWIYRLYNGVVLMRKNTGWQIYGTNRWHPTWEDAVKDVDERSKRISEIINKSIIKP